MESFHPVRLSCIVLVLHILTKLFADMTSWSVNHVLEFAERTGLAYDDLKKLEIEGIDGQALLGLTVEMLKGTLRLGQAIKLLKARDKFLECMLLRFTPHVVPHYTDLVFLFALSCVLSCSL